MNMKQFNNIKQEYAYKDERGRLEGLLGKCLRLGIKLYIKESDFKKYKNDLYKHSGHPIYTPKYLINGVPLRRYLKENNINLKVGFVRNRLSRGWTLEEAITIPKGDSRFKKRKPIRAMVKHKKSVVFHTKSKGYTGDGIESYKKLFKKINKS